MPDGGGHLILIRSCIPSTFICSIHCSLCYIYP